MKDKELRKALVDAGVISMRAKSDSTSTPKEPVPTWRMSESLKTGVLLAVLMQHFGLQFSKELRVEQIPDEDEKDTK